MAVWIKPEECTTTAELLASVLIPALQGERVQFLVRPGHGSIVVQRLRVALSRSRKRNEARRAKIKHFALHDHVYSYTAGGTRSDCIVLWTSQTKLHKTREILDDVMEREL